MVKASSPAHAMMELALVEARRAAGRGEVPVGAVLVGPEGGVLAVDGNRSIELHDPAGHAELLALRSACRHLANYRLPEGCTLYVTLEPCPMCAAAMVQARLSRLVFGTRDPKGGGVESCYGIGTDGRLNHRFVVESGLLAEECGAVLKDFFRARR